MILKCMLGSAIERIFITKKKTRIFKCNKSCYYNLFKASKLCVQKNKLQLRHTSKLYGVTSMV